MLSKEIFNDHHLSLEHYGVLSREVRTPEDLKRVDAMILPGGESTTMAKLLKSSGLDKALRSRLKEGMPTWGTCAGAILLAEEVRGGTPLDSHLGVLKVVIERNSYGRQSDSFFSSLKDGKRRFEAAFIRAPRIIELKRGVEVLIEHKGAPVLVQQQHILASTFHPELEQANPILERFLELAEKGK